MARVTHRAVPLLTALEAEDTPVLAETGATATAAWCVVAARNGAAQASSVRSGNARASMSAARETEGRGAGLEGRAPCRESPSMRSPEAWTRKRMEETHVTQRSRTTGATGARKSDTATIGRHAALHARARGDGEPGRDGQESAVDTPAAPTASERLGR
eukprot:3512526-Pleurochrysis_carterae.AAC.1